MFKKLLKRIISAIIKEVLDEVGIRPLSSIERTHNQRNFK